MSKMVIFYPKLEPNKNFHYMPISALAVASKLIADGHEVVIIDDRIEGMGRVFKEVDHTLLISVYTGYQVTRAYELSKLMKQVRPDVQVVWGGPHVNALFKQCLESEYVDDVQTGYAEQGENLIPWDLVSSVDYLNPESERFIYVSTYSCPGICTFCATKTRRKWIELPMEKVQKDIDNIMVKYPYKECVFFDATVFTNEKRVFELNNIMLKHSLSWIADARAVEIVRLNEFSQLSKMTGLKRLTIGLESGSPRIVRLMRKGANHLDTFLECAKILNNYNITLSSGVIFGCPGETVDDIKATIAYIKEVKKVNPSFRLSTTFFMPLPDTIMAEEAKKYGYKEPKTLEEWAIRGQEGHFKYNSWMNNPWIHNKSEYKKIYDDFIGNCDYLI